MQTLKLVPFMRHPEIGSDFKGQPLRPSTNEGTDTYP
jgi:hypothetical protein